MQAADYSQELEGAATGGRALEPPAFDGRTLGADFARLARPLPEFMLFGGMIVTRSEATLLLRAGRTPKATWLALSFTARYLADSFRHPRVTRLDHGTAVVESLQKTLRVRGGTLTTGRTGGPLHKRTD